MFVSPLIHLHPYYAHEARGEGFNFGRRGFPYLPRRASLRHRPILWPSTAYFTLSEAYVWVAVESGEAMSMKPPTTEADEDRTLQHP